MDFHTIARMASGASGAELANIVNEAALRAVQGQPYRGHPGDLEESVEVVIAGYQKKNAVLSDQEKKVVAYHEIGHALVAACRAILHRYRRLPLFQEPPEPLVIPCRWKPVISI